MLAEGRGRWAVSQKRLMIPFILVHLTGDLAPMGSLFFFVLTETDRETIEELNIALRNERTRAEQIQQAFTNEKRQTEALKHVKEQADQLRSINKGYLLKVVSKWRVGLGHGCVEVHYGNVFRRFRFFYRL